MRGRGPHEASIHRAALKNNPMLRKPVIILVSKKPPVTTFHSLDSPTVAIGRSAKLLTKEGPTFGMLASAVDTTKNAVRARVIVGIVCEVDADAS